MSFNKTIFFGSSLDIQSDITKLPPIFSTGKYPGELHIPGYSFAGPGTNLEKRLNPITKWPRYDSLPINLIDWTVYYHDLRYLEADTLEAEDALAKKHLADEKMLADLDAIPSEDLTLKERLTRNIVKQ